MDRRAFLSQLPAVALALPSLLSAASPKHRVAVIGHTGRGNYGHGLDTVWKHLPAVEIVAVADADKGGLRNELAKLGIDRGFRDYRRMLREARPDLVSVCPRHADQHHDMALAAIEAGVKGIYLEKPFCRTPEEADSLVAACRRHGTKLALAHRNRYHPALQVIDQMIQEGRLGKILEIRGRGKGDRRGGDEDLWVLGCHVFNLICYFGGRPLSCSATMLRDGQPVTRDHLRPGAEGLGPLAANELHARYQMSSGLTATFDSIANDQTEGHGFGLQIVGSQGLVALRIDRDPLAHWCPGNPFDSTGEPRPWIPIRTQGIGGSESDPERIRQISNHVIAVRDLIDSVERNRRPLCDVEDGRETVEMICGVFESHRQGGLAVRLPLTERDHPLLKL